MEDEGKNLQAAASSDAGADKPTLAASTAVRPLSPPLQETASTQTPASDSSPEKPSGDASGEASSAPKGPTAKEGLSSIPRKSIHASQEAIKARKAGIKRAKERSRKSKRKLSLRRARNIAVFGILLLLIAAGVCFGMYRWSMSDDMANIQGKWQVEGGGSKIEITDKRIILNKEVSYEYSIDPFSKTITYDFGQLEGKGRYRFSASNNQLSVQDGDFSWIQTLFDDLPWTAGTLWDSAVAGKDASPSFGENSITLKRVG